jgi:hypothetical protein
METLFHHGDQKPGTYERVGIALDRERALNPLDAEGKPRHLYKEHHRVLEPFSDAVYAMARLIRGLSDDDLALLAESEGLVSSVNCGWAEYEAARWSWVQSEVAYERQRRAKEAEADA